MLILLGSFFNPNIFLFVILPIFAIAPFALLLFKKRWLHSAVSVLFAFFLIGIWLSDLYLLAIFPPSDAGALGNAIDTSLNIFNTYIVPISIAFFLLLILLSLSTKMRHRLPILKQSLLVNSLLGITILFWFGINLVSTSSGQPETLETIPAVIPIEVVETVVKDARTIQDSSKTEGVNPSNASDGNLGKQNLWIVKTTFGTEFLTEPNDFFLSDSYAGVKELSLMDFEYEAHDSQQSSTDKTIFYLVASTPDSEFAFVELDSTNETFSDLPLPKSMNSIHRPSIADLNESESLVRLLYPSCTNCEPTIVDSAVFDIKTGEIIFISETGRFEWIDKRSFRYMPPRDKKYIIDSTSCGLGGCPADAYDWTGVEWIEGTI
jgi:hypothetical protein